MQLDPGLLKVSVGTDEEKLTVPVGTVVTPADVLTTVAVTVTGSPTAAAPLEKETAVEVERLATVRVAVGGRSLVGVASGVGPRDRVRSARRRGHRDRGSSTGWLPWARACRFRPSRRPFRRRSPYPKERTRVPDGSVSVTVTVATLPAVATTELGESDRAAVVWRALTASVSVCVAVCGVGDDESVAWTVKVKVPAADGVPEIEPARERQACRAARRTESST